MCTWAELKDGSLTMRDLMQMHRSLNLKSHLEKLTEEAVAAKYKQETR